VVVGPVSVIPVSISASGTYDQTLAFIKALYALPRLTVISSVDISGGGTQTTRSTALQSTYSLDIFALPSATTPTPAGAG
jgi:Tfp pilus assembly protein PilO